MLPIKSMSTFKSPGQISHAKPIPESTTTAAALSHIKPTTDIWASYNRNTPSLESSNPLSQVGPISIPYHFMVIDVDGIKGKKPVVKTLLPTDAADALKHAKTLSIGDLHSSCLKLFETLLVGDLIHMPENCLKALHKLLLKMDNMGNLTNKLLDQKTTLSPLLQKTLDNNLKKLVKYDAEVSQLVPHIAWKDKSRKLIIIGDEVADRGAFDSTILKLFKHLDSIAPGNLEYLASNHGHSTLGFIVSGKLKNPLSINVHSMEKSLLAYKNSPRDVLNLKSDYLDHLLKSKVMYLDEKNKTIFSHAPISKDCLKTASWGLNVVGNKIPNYDQLNSKNLPRFVDSINKAYQNFIAKMISVPPKNRDKNLLFEKQLFSSLVNHYSNMDHPSSLPFTSEKHGIQLNVHGHYLGSKTSALEVSNAHNLAGTHNEETRIANLDNRIRQGDQLSGTSSIVALKD